MNQLLFNFYQGTGKDIQGRTFQQMLEMTDLELERSHTVIQWLFPLTEPSQHNPSAPLLDEETIRAMKIDDRCRSNLYLAAERIWNFLVEDYVGRPTWIRPKNHNFLRLTRIIKCFTLFQLHPAASFYALAKKYYSQFPKVIGEETWKFWQEAFHSDI